MEYELELTRANRLKVAQAFRFNKRVDLAIECVIEGQMGRVFVDDPAHPTVYCIRSGPFGYFAGEARSAAGRRLMQSLPPYDLLMPSPGAWVEVAQEIYGDQLRSFPRYSLSSNQLSTEHLTQLLAGSPFRECVIPISMELALQAAGSPEGYLALSDFDSLEDFIERGRGYTLLDGEQIGGMAYSSLVCSQGIEVSVYVEEGYRRREVATALCSRLMLDSLADGLIPHWDAANPESIKLARKLGYIFTESYDAYYHTNE